MTHGHQETLDETPTVSFHPTLGSIEDLKRARAQREAYAAEQAGGVRSTAYDPDEVVGGPTLGSLDELRFAHHAHACCDTVPSSTVANGDSAACHCCD